jgi:MEMO1 family protein
VELTDTLRPRIRPVEAFPITVPGERGGKRLLCLRDPSQVSPHIVGLQPPALFIIGLLDGEHSPQAIQHKFQERYGERLSDDELGGFLTNLEQSLMLEGAHFEAHRAEVEAAWQACDERPLKHQDGGYGGPVEGLLERLQSYFSHPDGPGLPTGSELPLGGRLKGLIAPHIDFGRGGPTYAWAYRELLAAHDIETVVVLGTSHVSLSRPFSVSRKPFVTPFGSLAIDTDLVDALEAAVGSSLESDGLVHAHEHSIELQALWLAALGALRPSPEAPAGSPPPTPTRPLRIVPVLCGALSDGTGPCAPTSDPQVEAFVQALQAVTATHPRRTLLLAAADLAHVGTGFGDREAPSAEMLAWVERTDLDSLQRACRLDASGFFEQVHRSQDLRRVCGLTPIYAMLRSLGAAQGKLLAYRACVDPQGFRTVTIASAAFYEESPAPSTARAAAEDRPDSRLPG